ncbi:MAG: PLP-dependent aminotransferase family protein [Clostridiales bacterium]|nr:PLP-dependent aminotransferase family protein [Clostridiales bacterium]
MLTIALDRKDGKPMYEQLYEHIRQAIESGELSGRLPSKRKLASHLGVSQLTVENAYAQLVAEGYISSLPKRYFYTCPVESILRAHTPPEPPFTSEAPATGSALYDLKTNSVDVESFPYSVWSRLMRECMRTDRFALLSPIHPQGDPGLRMEISRYLHDCRGMDVSYEQIVLGAGTEYLLGLIAELLPNASYALEDPGYFNIANLFQSRRLPVHFIPLDEEGLQVEKLEKTDASVALVTPSHQFPLGSVMSIGRRRQLLNWVTRQPGGFLIEDDFDSEFRFVLKPIPTLHSMIINDEVIYMNSFAKTLAPSLRIAYMALPESLMKRYRERMLSCSCTVSAFEQLTLKLFLSRGHYERHLNRMRNIYKSRLDIMLNEFSPLRERLSIEGQQAGLHLLLRVGGMTEKQMTDSAGEKGVKVYPLSAYYRQHQPRLDTVVAGYAGISNDKLRHAAALIAEAWR